MKNSKELREERQQTFDQMENIITGAGQENGVTVGDCQKLSRKIGDLIEIEDIISTPYVLEVSSPGLDRPLKKERDFLRHRGKKIQVKTFSPVEDRKIWIGTIEDFEDGTLHLNGGERVVPIALEKIAQAKLIIKF